MCASLSTGGAFEGVVDDIISPFGYKRGEGIDAGFGEHDWICSRDRGRTDPMFEALSPVDGKITGAGMYSSNKPKLNFNDHQYLIAKKSVCLYFNYFSR